MLDLQSLLLRVNIQTSHFNIYTSEKPSEKVIVKSSAPNNIQEYILEQLKIAKREFKKYRQISAIISSRFKHSFDFHMKNFDAIEKFAELSKKSDEYQLKKS